ncbi:MAG: flippase-like domain-containing protein [Ignavibacterium sp.]|nr:flippase-like domain-containing protein [Ignavibacterium sp.]
MSQFKKRIIIVIILSGILYLGFSIYSDFDELINSFKNFNYLLFPFILLLSLMNYFVRFLKWNYYLDLLKVKLSSKESIIVFLSGFLMSITPGKFGEIFKSYLIKQINGTSISKTAPVVLAERLTDFFSLSILALIGSYFFEYGFLVSLIMTLILIFGIILMTNKSLFEIFIRVISKVSFLKNKVSKFIQLFNSTETLLQLKPLLLSLFLSVISWSFECFGYYLIIKNFKESLNLFWAIFSYSFSTIVGAISMLPGGLGMTEGSFLIMLKNNGLKLSDSTAITIITRVSTLWFAVLIGIISFIVFSYKFGKVNIKDENNFQ